MKRSGKRSTGKGKDRQLNQRSRERTERTRQAKQGEKSIITGKRRAWEKGPKRGYTIDG